MSPETHTGRWTRACTTINTTVVVVVVVVTSLSDSVYMGRQVPQRDKKFQQIQAALKHICDVYGFVKMALTLCFAFR